MTDLFTQSSANVSPCGRYRYWLERNWEKTPPMVFVMLNPSTADADHDDPTIRRCVGFARREGAGGVIVVNLFGFRATDPRELSQATDPVGPKNATAIGEALLVAAVFEKPVICAWGSHKFANEQAKLIRCRSIDFNIELACLGQTKSGAPRHPLYIRRDQPLIAYP